EVFGPGWLLSPPLWESTLTPETRHAAALLPTTTLELSADAFGRHLATDPSLAAAVASWNAHQYGLALDHLAMLALRDPSRRVPPVCILCSSVHGSMLEPEANSRDHREQQRYRSTRRAGRISAMPAGAYPVGARAGGAPGRFRHGRRALRARHPDHAGARPDN